MEGGGGGSVRDSLRERHNLRLADPRLPARRIDPDRAAPQGDLAEDRRVDRHVRHRGGVRLLDRRTARPARPPGRGTPARRHALQLRERRRDPVRPEHPRRPALGLHGPRRHRGLDPDPPLLGRLHGWRRGLPALLRLPQLLRLLDAAAGPRRQLRPARRRLGLRRLRLLRADQLLVPARHRHRGRDEGVRDQRDRRHRPRLRRDPADQGARRLRLSRRVRAGARGLRLQRVDDRRDLPAAARRRLRQVGAAAAPHLAPRRDGGPDPRQRADPRGDDGHRGRLPDRPHSPALRARARRRPTSPPSSGSPRCWSRRRSPWSSPI